MGLFDNGIAEGIGKGFRSITGGIRNLITGDTPPEIRVELEKIEFEVMKLEGNLREKMLEIVDIDAKSSSKFQSWWRPAIGCVATISLFLYYVPQYLIAIFYIVVCNS